MTAPLDAAPVRWEVWAADWSERRPWRVFASASLAIDAAQRVGWPRGARVVRRRAGTRAAVAAFVHGIER